MTTFRLLWRYRTLIGVLVRRELNARYRASVLGFLWSMLNPLLLLLVYTVVFTTVFTPRVAGENPYALFLFAGLLPWLFFSSALLDSAITLVDNGPLLAKVMCPPEVFPAVTVLAQLVHHLLALPVLVAALAIAHALGLHPFPWTFVLLPLALLPWIVLTGGLAFGISALAVHFRDLRDLVGNLLNLLFFASPIIYSLRSIGSPLLLKILRLNPLASFVTVYRDLAFGGRISSPLDWGVSYGTALLAWLVGSWIFNRLRETLVEAV